MKYLKAEIMVGIFMLLGIIAAVILALKVAGLVLNSNNQTYKVYANFENVGSLRIRAPIRIGGDPKTLSPVVELDIEKQYDKLSSESKASIQTAGIIGEQYISITPGFYDEDMGSTYLKDGDVIHDTGSALVLEDLISKFVFNSSADKKDSQDKEQATKDEVAQ